MELNRRIDVLYDQVYKLREEMNLYAKLDYQDNGTSQYYATPNTLKDVVEKYGVAIIKGVLDDGECTTMFNEMWDYLSHITRGWKIPIDKYNPSTWRQFYELFPMHGMLIQHHEVGHCQASWNIRQNPKIAGIFAELWKCKPEELLVSFDGMSFGFPPETTNKGWYHPPKGGTNFYETVGIGTWFHTDQSFDRNDFECIQSWVTALDVNKGDATLAVLEGSNRFHGEFKEKYSPKSNGDWYKLSADEQRFYIEKGCKHVRIECKKGDMVFWDSRTIHCGTEPLKTRENPHFRAVIYVCYMPRRLATTKELEKKKKAFNEYRTTSHWPHKIKLFPKYPRTYGKVVEEADPVKKPILTELGMKLAGF